MICSMVLRNILTFLLVFSCRISFGGNYTSYEISKLGLFALDCSNITEQKISHYFIHRLSYFFFLSLRLWQHCCDTFSKVCSISIVVMWRGLRLTLQTRTYTSSVIFTINMIKVNMKIESKCCFFLPCTILHF